jgi:hypothetical protein
MLLQGIFQHTCQSWATWKRWIYAVIDSQVIVIPKTMELLHQIEYRQYPSWAISPECIKGAGSQWKQTLRLIITPLLLNQMLKIWKQGISPMSYRSLVVWQISISGAITSQVVISLIMSSTLMYDWRQYSCWAIAAQLLRVFHSQWK